MSTRAKSRRNAYHPPVREENHNMRNLAERVTALERVVQKLVTWTKIELLNGDDNPVDTVSQYSTQLGNDNGDTNNVRPIVHVGDAVTFTTKYSRGRSVAKKSTSGVRKNVKQVDNKYRDSSMSGLLNYGEKIDEFEDGGVQVKLEPIELIEINPTNGGSRSDGGASFEGGDDFEENSGDVEDYLVLIDPVGGKSPKNMDRFEDYDDDDYNPQEEDESGSDCSYIPTKKNKILPRNKTVVILPSSHPKATLPNPYIRLGPILTPEQLASSHNININDYILPKTKTTKGRRLKKPKIPRLGFKFQCDQCPYGSNFRWKYTEHYRHHTGERPFLCDTCGKGFRGKDLVTEHMKRCSKNRKSYPCPVEGCSETFKRERQIQSHINKMHKDSRRQCDICQQILSGPLTLYFHKKRMHQDRTFMCPICSHKFAFAHQLKTHVALHSNPNYVFREHKRSAPVEEEPLPPEPLDADKIYVVPPKFVCQEEGCGKSFPRKILLRNHMRASHLTEEERKVGCDVCGKIMKDHNHLRSHVRMVHSEERSHVCAICGQAFKHLIRHERGHANPNWKPRSNCKPKTFNVPRKEMQNQGLDLHQEPSSSSSASCEMVDDSLEGGDNTAESS